MKLSHFTESNPQWTKSWDKRIQPTDSQYPLYRYQYLSRQSSHAPSHFPTKTSSDIFPHSPWTNIHTIWWRLQAWEQQTCRILSFRWFHFICWFVRNTLSVLTPPMKMEQSVPKRRHIKFRCRGIAQKKEYNIQNTAEVWNQDTCFFLIQFQNFSCITHIRSTYLWPHNVPLTVLTKHLSYMLPV